MAPKPFWKAVDPILAAANNSVLAFKSFPLLTALEKTIGKRAITTFEMCYSLDIFFFFSLHFFIASPFLFVTFSFTRTSSRFSVFAYNVIYFLKKITDAHRNKICKLSEKKNITNIDVKSCQELISGL